MINNKKIITQMIKNHTTLCAIESCTGGYLSYLITKTPGSSKIFKGSIIAYSLDVKNRLLGIKQQFLKKTQGLTLETAKQLAKNGKKLFNCDIAVAIVGVAGPGSINKIPAGTVCIAVNSRNKSLSQRFHFTGNRELVRRQAAQKALNLLGLFI
jgi:PncC family amidohydrolase